MVVSNKNFKSTAEKPPIFAEFTQIPPGYAAGRAVDKTRKTLYHYRKDKKISGRTFVRPALEKSGENREEGMGELM
ncbi:MAG: hypothetical protein HFG08_04755 [Oscillibacter sp.]|nr:hypothetical protein [Oscillibacter sp.]